MTLSMLAVCGVCLGLAGCGADASHSQQSAAIGFPAIAGAAPAGMPPMPSMPLSSGGTMPSPPPSPQVGAAPMEAGGAASPPVDATAMPPATEVASVAPEAGTPPTEVATETSPSAAEQPSTAMNAYAKVDQKLQHLATGVTDPFLKALPAPSTIISEDVAAQLTPFYRLLLQHRPSIKVPLPKQDSESSPSMTGMVVGGEAGASTSGMPSMPAMPTAPSLPGMEGTAGAGAASGLAGSNGGSGTPAAAAIEISGVMTGNTRPMVILKSGSESAFATVNEEVRLGGKAYKVKSITASGATLQDASGKKTQLSVPDIFGYQPKTAGGESSGDGAAGDMPSGGAGSLPPGSAPPAAGGDIQSLLNDVMNIK